ncbi:hypothetical protein RQ479_12400 [Mesorhizobium sp. ISC25]|uniref:hypothetical protein n=1 Tax=Mesorhizobium sp. ISC25 TaxID=3077335 RepID=UPI0035D854AB
MATSDLLGSIPVHFARLAAERLELDTFMPPMESPAMDVTMYWHRRLDRDAGNAWVRGQLAAVASFDA